MSRLSPRVASALGAGLAVSCMLFKPLELKDDAAHGGASAGGAQTAGNEAQAGTSLGGASAGSGGSLTDGGLPGSGGTLASTGGETTAAGDGGGGAGGAVPCSSNAECNEDSTRPSFCRKSDARCVPLDAQGCRVVVGNPATLEDTLRNPRALYFGAFTEFADSQAAKTVQLTYELALREFQQAGDLPIEPTQRSPLVMVLCSNEGPAREIDARMRHLIVDVGVPAVLAAVPSADLLRNFDTEYGRKTFFLTPQKVSGALAAADTGGLVWSLLGPLSDLAGIYAATVRQFEQFWRSSTGEGLRVALVTDLNDSEAYELYTAVASKLRFNEGHTLSENIQAGTGLVVDQSTGQELFNRIRDFKPNLSISFVRTKYTQPKGIAFGIDSAVVQQPYHLLSPFNSGDIDALSQIFTTEKAVPLEHPEARFFGIDAGSALDDGSLQAKNDYLASLLSLYPDAGKEFENYYDAVYYLAYAIFAGDKPINGAAIARGMQRLYQGAEVLYVGPGAGNGDNIQRTFNALSNLRAIYLMGAGGPPNFDTRGSRTTTGTIYCFDAAPNLVANVYGYDPKTDQLMATTPSPACLRDFLRP